MPKSNVVLRDQNPTQLKSQGKEFVQNLPNENDSQIMKDEKPPTEAPCIELEEAKGEIKEIAIPCALESNESKRAVASSEHTIPLEVMTLQSEVFDECAPIIINDVANSESKYDLVLGREAKKKRIEVVSGNIKESFMKTDLDEFKDVFPMPIDFVIPAKFSDMIEKINLIIFFFCNLQ